MPAKFLILTLSAVFFASGCVLFNSELHTLRQAAASQKQLKGYVHKQDELFAKLLIEVKDNKLSLGLSREEFIKEYGDPVLAENTSLHSASQVLLYRYAAKYFTSDKVYAYFDSQDKLVYWEYQPYSK